MLRRKSCSVDEGRTRIKVLQVVNGMNIGGIQSFIMNLYRGIDKSLFDFVFLTYTQENCHYREEIEKTGGRLISIASGRNNSRIKHLCQLNAVIKRERPTVVHCHTYFDAAWVMLVAKHNGVPIRITHSHTTHGYFLKHKFIHSLLAMMIRRSSNVMLACGKDAGMSLFKKQCFKIVNNGIELEKFKYSEKDRIKIRKELRIDDATIVIGHVGRFSKEKNQVFLINLLKRLIQGEKSYKILLLGEGETKAFVQKNAQKNDLMNNVEFLGSVEDSFCYYNAFDYYVFPSIYEGFPVSLIEAQANGLPIIASSSIDSSSKINDNVIYLDLNGGLNKWVDTIIKLSPNRCVPKKKLALFSVENTVSCMEKIYSTRIGGQA